MCVHKWCQHSKRLTNHQQKVGQVTVQHTVHRHTLSQKLIRHLVLWPVSQISESQMDPAGFSLPSGLFLSTLLFLSSLPLPSFACFICVVISLSLLLSLFLCPPSDMWERDLVELVLEVSVSQVSHRQRDMLLRQVGVLLGVLDSDIIVREISAFNEHR